MSARYFICSVSKNYIKQGKAGVHGLDFHLCSTAALIYLSPQNTSLLFLLLTFICEGRENMTAPVCPEKKRTKC